MLRLLVIAVLGLPALVSPRAAAQPARYADVETVYPDMPLHSDRFGESIDIEREMATSTMEAYLSVVANRTNEIMKVLTVFSAILLPINLIASIYGMNFAHMPELQWRYGFHFAISLMAAIAVTMLFWFWRRGWLGSRRRDFLRRQLHVRRRLRRRTSTA